MTNHGRCFITNVSELNARLGDKFILLVGSAISGVAPPRLAMNIARPMLAEIARSFRKDTYIDSLYAKYCEQLTNLENTSFRALLDEELKFEEFLWLVSKRFGRDKLDELLALLYCCPDAEYGPSHFAVAQLLKSKRCIACLTTNFDNAIENACSAACAGIARPFTEAGEYPSALPESGDTPMLLKLHGSALARNCVADSAALLAARSDEVHGKLPHLLKGRKVLVVGYSGVGDIDISPQLSKAASTASATFFWVHPCVPEAGVIPDWASFVVISNVEHPENVDRPNILFDLAKWRPDSKDGFASHRRPSELIAKWLEPDLDNKGLVKSILDWKGRNARAHLEYADRSDLTSTQVYATIGWSYVQSRAYWRASRAFTHGLKLATHESQHCTNLRQGAAFADWRLGRWERARESLLPVVRRESSALHASPLHDEIMSDSCRVYLEICRDMLQFVPRHRRSSVTREWNLQLVSQRLRLLLHKLPSASAENKLLASIVIRNIEWLNGEPVRYCQVKELFDACLHSRYPTAGWGAIGLLLQMSFHEGLKDWRRLHKHLKEAGRRDYLVKNYESLMTSIGMFLPRATYRLIRFIYLLRSLVSELNLSFKLLKWAAWRKHWYLANVLWTEAD